MAPKDKPAVDQRPFKVTVNDASKTLVIGAPLPASPSPAATKGKADAEQA